MTTTDHAQEAVVLECSAWRQGGPNGDALIRRPEERRDLIASAQVHATLAVAEQLRIANLIALGSIGSAHRVLADQVSADAAKTLAEFHAHETPEVGGWWQLRPEIATRLGLDGGAES